MDLTKYIISLSEIHSDKCLVITDAELEKPHPFILWANPAFERLTGYYLSELVEKSPRVLQGDKSDRLTLDRLKKTLAEGGVFEGGITNYKKDGSEFFKAWRIAPIVEEGKTILYFAVHQESTPAVYLDALKSIKETQERILETLNNLCLN